MSELTLDLRHAPKDRAYAQLLCDKGIISAEECAAFVKPPHSPYRDRLG